MILRTLIVSAAMAALAMPAMAGPTKMAAEPSTTVAPVAVDGPKKARDDDKSRMVCKRMSPAGSRTPGKKVCRTAGEWQSEEANAKEQLEDVSRRSLTSAPKT